MELSKKRTKSSYTSNLIAMRLLPPKELNTKINEQKKTEIDAGLFLAKKIDALRENLADAQKEHDDAIIGINNELKILTIDYVSKKGALEKEIKELEERRLALQEPLDDAWEEFHRQSDELSIQKESLQDRQYMTLAKETELQKKQDEITKLHQEVIYKENEADNLLRHASNLLEVRKNEGQDLLSRKEAWENRKVQEEQDIERRKLEADNVKKEYEVYLESTKKKERLLDLKLRKYGRD